MAITARLAQAGYAGAVHLGLIAVVVSEYDPAIAFFVGALGFELAEDSPALLSTPRAEPYGEVAVFLDIAGNKWDLIGRPPEMSAVR
jgi:catechol 2,3-dioxygenase-like lactoylglutathione lyase family enzyme